MEKKNGKKPELMCGHSLGEYSALVCSDAIKFSDAVKIVFLRGTLMQKQVMHRPSKMCAINGLNENVIRKICFLYSKNQIVSLSSINSHNQVVISGDEKAVKKASICCKKKGAKSIINLNITIPAHCMIMKPICTKFKKILKKTYIHKPNIPVINNVDVQSEIISINIKNALIRQIYNPVRWKEIINYILSKNIFSMLEIGPKNILTNLNKKNKNIIALHTDNLNNFLKSFHKIHE